MDEDILAMIIAAEGTTYTNDPTDAGGPTRYGITLETLSRWRGVALTAADVQALTRTEAEAIYRMQYIKPFALLPDGLRQNVVDMGVNAGVTRAAWLCQQLVGAEVDGQIGSSTAKLAQSRDWTEFYSVMRIAFYEALIERKPSQAKYRRGWRNRAMRFVTQRAVTGRSLVEAFMSERVGKAW